MSSDQDSTKPLSVAPGPLFVVSMWRSGSSLLYALLNKHPEVALTFEADLLLLKTTFLKPRAFCDWAERWEFWNRALHRHGLAPTDFDSAISDFPAAFTAAHQLYARRRGATIWGDKSPNYYDRLNEMADDFPQARFIIVWRNPEGTVNSILRAASLGNSYFSRAGAPFCALLGYEVFKQECDRLLARGKPVCQVNYEDLIADTPSVMRQVCNFLQISYDDSLSTLQGADRSSVLHGQHHANLKGDQIVRGPRPQLLTPALRERISAYLALWQGRYGTAWPPYPPIVENSAPPVARLSEVLNRILYRVLRLKDRISPLVFSLVPISPLRFYRALKAWRRAGKQNEAVSPSGVKAAATVEGRP